MYAVTSIPEDRRTRHTLRRAEFGFLGVVVYTRVHTPRRCGEPFSAGVLAFSVFDWRALRTSCWIVGNVGPTASFDLGVREPVPDPRGRAFRCSSAGHRENFCSWDPDEPATPRWRCTRGLRRELCRCPAKGATHKDARARPGV